MGKLTLSLLAVVLVSVLGLGWTLDSLFQRYSEEPMEDRLHPYREVGTALSHVLDMSENPQADIRSYPLQETLKLSVMSADEFALPTELQSEFNSESPLALESSDGITLHFYMPKNEQVLSIASPAMKAEDEKSPLSLMFTVLFYSGILLLILIWLYPLVKQLMKLRETAKAFGHGDLSRRVSRDSVSYISDIENEFNRMANRIEDLIRDNKLLSSAVSHDLRTPLARLRFGIDTLAEESDPQVREKYQHRINRDLTEMESLVETLLNYARMEESMVKVDKLPVDLISLINRIVESYTDSEIQLSIKTGGTDANVLGDEKHLSMLVNNLLKNAIRHAVNKVQVSIAQEENTITLTIEDDGEGIPQSEREAILKPFIRGSNTTTDTGYGMGLAIVKRIADWHNSELVISKSPQLGGAQVNLRMPQTNARLF